MNVRPLSPLRRAALALLAAATLAASNARADDAFEKAKDYFRAGAQAYAVGEYAAAVQAFEQANALAPRPAVLFSIAQAERRLYFLDNNRSHLIKAIRLFRQYLDSEPQAARKVDAVQALSELVPLATPGAPSGAGTPAEGPGQGEAGATTPREALSDLPAPSLPTRVMISSPSPAARISLDGKPAALSPFIAEVEPGRHVAHISAPGYREVDREVVAVRGALVTIDVALKELSSYLVVVGPDGALLSVDGRVQGECPFPKPLELTAGPHLVTLTKSGFVGISREQPLLPGQTVEVLAPMHRTRQRTAALLMMGGGAALFAAGGAFLYFGLGRNAVANEFLERQGKEELQPSDRAQYEVARRDRDRLYTAALVAAGAGAAVSIASALMYFLDGPSVAAPPRTGSSGAPDQGRTRDSITATPLVAPGFAGLGLQGHF